MPKFSDNSESKNTKAHTGDVSEALLASLAGNSEKSSATDKPVGFFTKAEVIAAGTLTGMVNHGLSEAINNPARFGTEIAGATALTLAMKGPGWVKLPALGVAAVGTAVFAGHAAEATSKAIGISDRMTNNNLNESKAAISETLGPLAFDAVMMVGAGHLGSRMATNLPRTFPSHLTNLADSIMPKLSFEMGPQLALEGAMSGIPSAGTRLRFNTPTRHEAGLKPMPENTMAMVKHGEAGGAVNREIIKEGYKILNFRGTRGEDVQLVDKMPALKPIELLHGDHSISRISANGKVVVAFPSGEARMLDLGLPIKRVTVSEYAGGQKQYRLNETVLANMEVNNVNHEVKALLGNGDHLHMVDNVQGGFMNFNHKDGVQTWIEHSGRMVFKLPNGHMSEATIPSKLAHIRLTERPDGSKQFQFLDPEGALLAHKVELPAYTAKAKTLDEVPQWRQLNNYLAGRPENSGRPFEMHRVEPDGGGMAQGQRSMEESFPIWNPRFRPTTVGRLLDEQVAGVDRRVMRGNDLDSPADMALAQQNHGWMVKRYLSGLDRQDDFFGN
ncbi:hypothetical protein KBI23_21855 [bacterium]|nr:hypothetical protein [bacterium]MBP9810773.1 hypothetical protein [bacterium]